MTTVYIVLIKGSWYIDSVYISESRAKIKAAMLERGGYHCEIIKRCLF